jgi:hypothetical protein
VQEVTVGTISGTEDAYTLTTVSASNPFPIDITTATIDVMLGTDFSSVFGTSSVIGSGVEAGAVLVTLATDSSGTVATTNAGTFVVQEDGAALTALQLIDDVVYVDDTATHATGTTKGAGIMAAATPTDTSIDANDIGMLAMSTDRRLHTDTQIVGQDADITIADGGNVITVDGTVTANLSATDNTVLDNIDTNTTGLAGTVSGSELQVDVVAALPAGTNAIGKLAANSGVDIGDVDITSQIPGTGATNLGKAIDSAVGSTDTGVALLGKHMEDQVHLATADGDYDVLTLDSLGSVHVNAESHHVFDEMNAATGWAGLNSDTTGVATTTNHVLGTNAIEFDKVDGAANTVFGAIAKTITTVDIGAVSPHDIIQVPFYLSSVVDVEYLFIRLGTDSSNYTEWRIPDENLTAGSWELLSFVVGDAEYSAHTGNGWDSTAITYVVVGAAFDAQNDTLANMAVDQISYHTNQHTNAIIGAEVTSSISSPNINLQKIGNTAVADNTGVVGNGTLRVTLATDDAAVTSLGVLDNAISGSEMQVDVVAALPAGTNAIGKLAANSGVDIGDVDVLSVIPGTGATNLGKAQDTAVGATDTGVAMLAQRDDEQAAVTPVDGDYVVPRCDKFGNLKVTQLPDATSEVKYAIIDAASSGDNTIQAAAGAGVKIRVLSAFLVSAGTVTTRFESGAAGTALTGQMNLVANSGFTLPYNPAGWFETADNTLLNLELSAAISVDGCITYVEV